MMISEESYSQMAARMRAKFANYSYAMCAYAIKDCHETLNINPEADPSYIAKLWAEIDAARERAQKIQKGL